MTASPIAGLQSVSVVVLSAYGGVVLGLMPLLLSALALPDQLETVADSMAGGLPRMSGRVLASLISIMSFEAALTSLWIYFVPVSLEAGHDAEQVATAVGICIGAQILGGLAAIAIGRRLGYGVLLGGATVIALGSVLLIERGADLAIYTIAVATFGFSWRLAVPYHVELMIAADPSRRFAIFTASAQGLGVAAGPFIASLAVTEHSVTRVVDVSSVLFLLSLTLFAIVCWRARGLVSRPVSASSL